jgi:hypothetical protein
MSQIHRALQLETTALHHLMSPPQNTQVTPHTASAPSATPALYSLTGAEWPSWAGEEPQVGLSNHDRPKACSPSPSRRCTPSSWYRQAKKPVEDLEQKTQGIRLQAVACMCWYRQAKQTAEDMEQKRKTYACKLLYACRLGLGWAQREG